MNRIELYNEVFEEYYSQIHRRINRMISDPDASDDLTQETFARLILHIDTLRDKEHIRNWLYRVAHRLTLDYIDKNKRLFLFADEEELFGEEAAAPHQDTTRNLMAAELLRQILAFVRSWDETSQLIYLGKLNGRTSSDLAEELGCTSAAVDGKFNRLRKRIMRKYSNQWRALHYDER